MADDNAAQAAPKANDNAKTTNAPAGADSGTGDVKVRLLAQLWMRPVEGSNPIKFVRLRKGAVTNVSREVFDQLNAGIKPTFEEVTD